ncbi:MAG: pentapeptide repeat-containing protein [Pseudomonadota bacterium]
MGVWIDWIEAIGGVETLLAVAALLAGAVLAVRAMRTVRAIKARETLSTWAKAAASDDGRDWALERLRKNYLWLMILAGAVAYVALWTFITGRLPLLARDAVGELAKVLGTDPLDHEALRNIAYAIGALLGGTALLAAVPFQLIKTWMNERQAITAEQGHITDRITKAVEQLGAEKTVKRTVQRQEQDEQGNTWLADRVIEETQPNIEVRLGAIYALERIAQDSERDHIPIMETLCAYIRENAPASSAKTLNLAPWEPMPKEMTEAEREQRDAEFKLRFGEYAFDPRSNLWQWSQSLPKPRADVQAALRVIGRRKQARQRHEEKKDYRLDLSGTNLRRTDLNGAHLERAVLREARLEGADLREAHLERAHLGGAHLERADLGRAHLERAYLGGARLERAYLGGARLEGADLRRAHLERADLREAHLERAGLEGANLKSADLTRWHMAGTRVRSADFSECTTLTQEGVNSAFGDVATVLPDHILRPDHWDEQTGILFLEDKAYNDWIARGAPASKTGMVKPGEDGA